jgi:hypothetical protein
MTSMRNDSIVRCPDPDKEHHALLAVKSIGVRHRSGIAAASHTRSPTSLHRRILYHPQTPWPPSSPSALETVSSHWSRNP